MTTTTATTTTTTTLQDANEEKGRRRTLSKAPVVAGRRDSIPAAIIPLFKASA